MNRKAILIVDDVELNRAILAELFHDAHAILEAADGREALNILRARREEIAIVLLDIIMPVMDGYDVLRAMNEEELLTHIPVVLITSESSETASLKSYDLGVSDIINKPFHPGVVKRRVGNIIELYQHKDHLEKLVSSQVEELEKQAKKIGQASSFVIDALSAVLEFRSGESGHHIKRIRQCTQVLLEGLMARHPQYKLTPATIDKITLASSMHDIGKIAIPDSILGKPARLTPEEFEIMKTHSAKGCEILKTLSDARGGNHYRYSYEICRHHHERWDGKGYPDGLAGPAIPLWAQVVSLADVYDALIGERPYKPRYTHEQAVNIILHEECGAFNPDLIDVFVQDAERLKSDLEELNLAAPCEPVADDAAILPDEFFPADGGFADLQNRPGSGETLSDRTLRLLEREREKNRIVAELSGDIVFSYDAATDTIEFSEKYHEVFGRDTFVREAHEVIRQSPVIYSDDKEVILRHLTPTASSATRDVLELRMMTRKERYEWFEVYAHVMWDSEEENRCVGIIGKLVNINERKAEASRLREQAGTDALTGLDNRQRFEERVTAMLLSREGNLCAFMFLDIDDFKSINDTLGHLEGDNILRGVASAIRRQLRESDVVGRIGGDEFVIFLRNVSSQADVARKAGQICEACAALAGSDKGQVSCSVGVALCPADGVEYQQLVKFADKALYAAKAQGKNRYALYRDLHS